MSEANRDNCSENETCNDSDCSSCGQQGHTQAHADQVKSELALREQMDKIKNKILVLSGKGGVGKSTVAVNLAQALANRGKKVGLLDIDIHGPSVPTMLGLNGQRLSGNKTGQLLPILHEGMKVISIGFLLPDEDNSVIWRGPLKMGVIQQFLRDVEWGELDYLVVDAPPGTGDEPLSVGQFLPEAKALIVTTPQRVSAVDVRKSINFCRQLNIDILGLVENMNGLVCPHCSEHISVFPDGEAVAMAKDLKQEILASLPLDPSVSLSGDKGAPFVEYMNTPVGQAMQPLLDRIAKLD